MLLLTIILTTEMLALVGWYCDVNLYGDDKWPSFIINQVVFVIIGAPFINWIINL